MRIYAASHMTSAKDQISQTKMKFRWTSLQMHALAIREATHSSKFCSPV